MSWHYLQEQEEASWEESCLDGAPSALLSLLPTQGESSSQDNETGSSQDSLSGMTLRRLTDDHGKDVLMWYQGDSPVRTYLPQEGAQESTDNDLDCGPRWQGSLARYNPDSYSWKTRQCSLLGGLIEFSETFPRWGTMQDGEFWGLLTPGRRTNANGSGLWPTPCKCVAGKSEKTLEAVANGLRQKTLDRQLALRGFGVGIPNPTWVEWLMGWPTGWTDMQPLETDRFQQWLSSHGKSLDQQ